MLDIILLNVYYSNFIQFHCARILNLLKNCYRFEGFKTDMLCYQSAKFRMSGEIGTCCTYLCCCPGS